MINIKSIIIIYGRNKRLEMHTPFTSLACFKFQRLSTVGEPLQSHCYISRSQTPAAKIFQKVFYKLSIFDSLKSLKEMNKCYFSLFPPQRKGNLMTSPISSFTEATQKLLENVLKNVIRIFNRIL